MKRIFHIISHFDMGGAERVAANIAKSRHAGYEYHVVELLRSHTHYTEVFLRELEAEGICCHRSLIPEFHFHYVVERLAAVLFPLRMLWLWLRYHPAVVHSHTEMPDMAVWLSFTLLPWMKRDCRVVRTIHNTQLWTGLKKTGKRVETFFQGVDANIAISESVRRCYAACYAQLPPIIYNGVSPVATKEYPGLLKDKKNILFAGRLESQKGIHTLIDIILSTNVDLYHFHILGDGSLRALIMEKLQGRENVSINPPVYGLSAYLASFDYLLMPSEFEGLSMLSIEASMQLLPVIANDCPGLADTLPPDWPLCAHGNRLEDYVRIFAEVLPAAHRNALAQKAHAFAQQHFSVENMQWEYEKVYGRIFPA